MSDLSLEYKPKWTSAWPLWIYGSRPSCDRWVLDAVDVVLAETASGLDLDQFERDLAWILQPVDSAHQDVNRFVFVHDLDVDGHAPLTTIDAGVTKEN
jgi:hypothetical protein